MSKIDENKSEFLGILRGVNVEGANIEGLIAYLEEIKFFEAPATAQSHGAFPGGLCQHALNTFKVLSNLIADYGSNCNIDQNSVIIVGLLSKISTATLYEQSVINKKVYRDGGSKHDNLGSFDWMAQDCYKIKDAKDRVIGGTNSFNSLMIINKYIPLTYEESVAIINQTAGVDEKNPAYDTTAIFNEYPLATMLHSADFLSSFILEKF